MTVKVHIERLSVEGGSYADARRVAESLRVRLAELAAAGFLPRNLNLERLDAGEIPRGASPEQIGRHSAAKIFQTVKGSRHV